MPSPISVFIEMPVYLKKYLLYKSKNKQEPIIFSKGNDYNLLLTRLITNDTREQGYRWSAYHKEKKMKQTLQKMQEKTLKDFSK